MCEDSYDVAAQTDAADMATEFLDEIVEQLFEKGAASDDYNNDYHNGDSYHYEHHVDRSYTLLEADELLDELHRDTETDAGMWSGLEPREAIAVQAACTYGNAVARHFADLIAEINGDSDLAEAVASDEAVKRVPAAVATIIVQYRGTAR